MFVNLGSNCADRRGGRLKLNPNACDLSAIRETIHSICYFVEEHVAGEKDAGVCNCWARKNAFRHSLSLCSILNYLKSIDAGRRLKILNLSGLYPGHQDFSICLYLQRENVPVEYYAVDHPNSPFLSRVAFCDKVSSFGIRTILKDVKTLTRDEIVSEMGGTPDIVLFTEIAEHLEHGTFLQCLRLLSDLLPNHGLLLFSTPNADAWKYRFAHLMGRELSYWGDGTLNMTKGLFGHIVYYNIPRLRRLLRDAGLEIQRSLTVNFPAVEPRATHIRMALEQTQIAIVNTMIRIGERAWRMPTLMNGMKTLGELIYLEVRKGSEQKIPFAL